MKYRIWITLAFFCLVGYGAIFFVQYQTAREQTLAEIRQRQLWLARQSARFFERDLADGALLTEALRSLQIGGADGRLGASRLVLFDRQGGQFLSTSAPPPGLAAQVAAGGDLQRRLQRGSHGHLEVTLADELWLVTYLPLRAGDMFLTLVLLLPADTALLPVKSLAASQWSLPLLLLGMAATLGTWRLRRAVAPPETEAEATDASARFAEQLRAAQAQCQVLVQENALLGVARREYQLLVEGAGYGLARLNSNGLIMFCSKPLLQLLGCERKDIVGRNLLDLDLLPPATRQQLQQAVGRLRQGEVPPPVSGELSGRDGCSRPIELRLSPLGVAGEMTGILLQLQEIPCARGHLRVSVP